MEIKRAIVTGGAGFIGSNLVDGLLAKGVEVAVIDNLRSGRRSNLEHISDKITFYNFDIRDEKCSDFFNYQKPDAVFHLAAIPGVSYSVEHPTETNDVNVSGTVNLLELSKQHGVKKFVFSSSSSIYGGSEILPTSETITLNPKSPYALQKKVGEEYCKLFSDQSDMQTVALRYFNVFGPRQYGDSPYAAVIAAFADSIKNNTAPQIHGDGEQFRDFCYIDNVVSANILAAEADLDNFEAFNVGCGGRITVNSLHEAMKCQSAEYTKSRAGDVRCSQADISKAESLLGYKVLVPFEEGIEKTLEWYFGNGQ